MAEVPNTLENEFFMEQLSDILNQNETHDKIIKLAQAEAGLNEFDGEELASPEGHFLLKAYQKP